MLLRFVLNRPLSCTAGVLLMAPGVWLLAYDYRWESGVTDGLSLLAVASGAALAWSGLTGRQSDWIEPSS
jgi:hypothetical protein